MHMHGGALTILDPSAAPQGLDVHRFREIMAARLDQLAPFRQRLITTPFGIDRPVWVDDHRFDVRAHIRRSRCRTLARPVRSRTWPAN